jgi:hypothetical protein
MSERRHDNSNEHTICLKVIVVSTRWLAVANSWDGFPDRGAEEFVAI